MAELLVEVTDGTAWGLGKGYKLLIGDLTIIKCTYCSEPAKHNTVVFDVYLCEEEECWTKAVKEVFIDSEL